MWDYQADRRLWTEADQRLCTKADRRLTGGWPKALNGGWPEALNGGWPEALTGGWPEALTRFKFPILWEGNLAQILQYGEEPAEASIQNFLHMSFLYLDCSNSVLATFFEVWKHSPYSSIKRWNIFYKMGKRDLKLYYGESQSSFCFPIPHFLGK